MNVLLSAYACEPGLGSESEVGWQWAKELACAGKTVWVLTRPMHRNAIDNALAQSEARDYCDKLHIVYYDLPFWARRRGGAFVQLHYFLWQIGIFRVAKALAAQIPFDAVHHVTFVSVRQPSFLGYIGIPFTFGPVAGGECAPFALRRSFPLKGWLRDFVRDLANLLVRVDPLMWLTFSSAERIYTTSPKTKALLPKRFQAKCQVMLAIGSGRSGVEKRERRTPINEFRILFVGKLLYLKGIHLGLRAVHQVLHTIPHVRLTIVGSGPDESWLKSEAERLGLGGTVDWVPWVGRADVMKIYQNHDVLLFPSLHDSGGLVILEALGMGVPVVCLKLGGPGVIVDDSCGAAVETEDKSEDDITSDLAASLRKFATDADEMMRCSSGALVRARLFKWRRMIETCYGVSRIGENIACPDP